MKIRTSLAALALFGLLSPQAAIAQDCVSEAEASALFVYAMPSALDSARNTCSTRLKPNGFFATDGSKLIGRYIGLKDEAWPKAKRALLLFASSRDGRSATAPKANDPLAGLDPAALLASLPDRTVRPLVDAIIVQKVAENIRPENCSGIERVAAAVAPIDPRSAAVLVGTVLSLTGFQNPKICKSEE